MYFLLWPAGVTLALTAVLQYSKFVKQAVFVLNSHIQNANISEKIRFFEKIITSMQIDTKHLPNIDKTMCFLSFKSIFYSCVHTYTCKGRILNLALSRRVNWKCNCCFPITNKPHLCAGKTRRERRSGFIIPQDTSAGES